MVTLAWWLLAVIVAGAITVGVLVGALAVALTAAAREIDRLDWLYGPPVMFGIDWDAEFARLEGDE